MKRPKTNVFKNATNSLTEHQFCCVSISRSNNEYKSELRFFQALFNVNNGAGTCITFDSLAAQHKMTDLVNSKGVFVCSDKVWGELRLTALALAHTLWHDSTFDLQE